MDALLYHADEPDSLDISPGILAIPAKASASQLCSLADALDTLCKVVNGIASEPRFRNSPTGGLNCAGKMLEAISELLCERYCEAIDQLRVTAPRTELATSVRRYELMKFDIGWDTDLLNRAEQAREQPDAQRLVA